jgi:hypothetical protein
MDLQTLNIELLGLQCLVAFYAQNPKFKPTDAEQRELHFTGIKLHLDKMMKEDKEIDCLVLRF